ncbi:3'(2'),5'-bisphosphate nucleotidase CysQ [Arenibaculum pallidiluteum]|uniref:3'(2'),5'-bisphosphate nucleotidase CysQ n=1 Tax=Arenibaculum pallidiluteum TaxID=2812559 RepID=UPI001A976A4C|nr:3'(2'),5'-bisphosphate nucleotidase CysQ [Arenibaculum pallidiluteum]
MPDAFLAKLLPQVRTIAREAGQIVLRYYLDGIPSELKADGSPVTTADHAAEGVIMPALHHLTPDIPVISEENHAAGLSAAVKSDFWLVDPLDGTRSFVDKTDEFTVNIGLVRGGVPVLGVIYAPVSGEMFAAAGPGTAMQCVKGRDKPIFARRPPAEGLTVVASRRHVDEGRLTQFLAGQTVARELRSSSAYKFCLLASGQADLYPRFGPTSEWDTAAGHAILTAAGGSVLTPEGTPLSYAKPDFRNGDFIAYGLR